MDFTTAVLPAIDSDGVLTGRPWARLRRRSRQTRGHRTKTVSTHTHTHTGTVGESSMAGWLTAVVTPTKIVCTPTTEQCETVHFSTDIHPTATKRVLAQSRGPSLAASVQTFPLAKRCAVKPTCSGSRVSFRFVPTAVQDADGCPPSGRQSATTPRCLIRSRSF